MERSVVEEALMGLGIDGRPRATPEERDQASHRRFVVEEIIKQHRARSLSAA